MASLGCRAGNPSITMIRPYRFEPPPPPCGTYGHCHAYAIGEVEAWYEDGCPEPAPVLCRGECYLEEHGRRLDHSWIERGGYSYDWQRIVVRKLEAVASPVFNQQRYPCHVTRYAPDQVGWTMWSRSTPPARTRSFTIARGTLSSRHR